MSDFDLDNSAENSSKALEQQIEQLLQQKPRRRWLRWGFAAFCVLLVSVVLAPTLICKTPLGVFLVSTVLPEQGGEITVESLEFGWFSSASISGIRFTDAAGELLLEIPHASVSQSLLDLARNPSNLGTIVLTQPKMNLTLRPDGSNLEDVVARLSQALDLTASAESGDAGNGSGGFQAQLQLIDAQVVATDTTTETTWRAHDVGLTVVAPSAADADWKLDVAGFVDGRKLEATCSSPMGLTAGVWPLGPSGTGRLVADALPMSPLRYIAQRTGLSLDELHGEFTADVNMEWSFNTSDAKLPAMSLTGALGLESFRVADERILGQDVFRIASAKFESRAHLSDRGITIDQANLRSDYGNGSIAGELQSDEFNDLIEFVSGLDATRLKSNGEIDLAALMQSLPNTFQVRDDIQVDSGKLKWVLESSAISDAATRWQGRLQTDAIEVSRKQQPLDWRLPLDVDFSLIRGDEVELEKLTASSFFFALSGSGKLREGQFHARANLERMMYQLGQILDLNHVYLRGQLQTVLRWHEGQPNQIALDCRTQLSDFMMTQNEQLVCQEEELTTSARASATIHGQQVVSMDSFRVDLLSGSDFLVAELQSPVASPSTTSTWDLACRLKGDLASWFHRAQTVGIGRLWQVSGLVDTTALVTADSSRISIRGFDATIADLKATSDGISIQEPRIQIQSAGTIDLTTGNLRVSQAKVESTTLSCSANQVAMDLKPSFQMSGNLGYRADIGRLAQIVPAGPLPASRRYQGKSSGTLVLNADGQTSSFDLQGTVQDLVVSDERQVVWQEPHAQLQSKGIYDAGADRLQLEIAQITGNLISVTAAGQATSMTSQPKVDFQGEYTCYLDKLTPVLQDLFGADVRFAGQQRQVFMIKGPVFPGESDRGKVSPELVAQGQIGWQSANLFGVPLGAVQFDTDIRDGLLTVHPVNIAVGQGFVRLAPTLHLNTDQMWMTQPSGALVDHVRIDPRMTAGWMKYIAPLMADATSAEGAFSVHLSKTEVPLLAPSLGRIEGQLVIHDGTLGPGPMANLLVELATWIKAQSGNGSSRIADTTKNWVQLQEQQIDFRMADGRVYHQGFRMTVDGVPVTTRGSVGIEDQSLEVMVDVPVMDEWIQGSPQLNGLRGATISVPIRGTTSSPQVDRRALSQATLQLAQRQAATYLQGQLNEKLGGDLQDVLGGAIGGLLNGGQNPSTSEPNRDPNAQRKLETQLQDRAREEVWKGLNKLFD